MLGRIVARRPADCAGAWRLEMIREKRGDARRAAGDPAWVTIEGSAIRHGCMVSNVSDGGARIEFPRARRLPDRFFLKVGEAGTPRLCRMVWRQGRQFG